MEQANDEARQVPLDFRIPDDMPLGYATTVVVQHTQDEFVLSFFAVAPPVFLGEPESVRQRQESLTSIPAHCVARIVLTPSRMEQLAQVVNDNLAKYRERFGARSASQEEVTEE